MKVKSESESKVTQLCLTLCNSMNCSLPGTSIHGISQARILEWDAISFSRISDYRGLNRYYKSSGASQVMVRVKNMYAKARDAGSIPGLGRSPGERNGNPLQYSCLENSMDREAWQATVHGGYKELDMTNTFIKT